MEHTIEPKAHPLRRWELLDRALLRVTGSTLRRLGRRRRANPGGAAATGRPTVLPAVVAVIAALGSACAGPGEDATPDTVPDSFTVAFETSAGPFEVRFVRSWSPLAVDRIHELAQDGYWDGARIYRVNDRYAQFGYSGDPAQDSVWIPAGLPDEPVTESNVRGTVSLARGGPGTRSAILFVNRTDNTDLDDLAWNGVVGFPPVGRVVSGMSTIDALFAGYGDQPMQWEDSIASLGNDFLGRLYPELDSITGVEIARQEH